MKRIIVTGGAGFIGSALVRHLIRDTTCSVNNIDKLTYAGNLDSLRSVQASERYLFAQVDVASRPDLRRIFRDFQPDWIIHLAAESHVDRSIDDAADFIQTNVVGTYAVLEEARQYWNQLDRSRHDSFRLLHVSTDEVFGSLGPTGFFTEDSLYRPSSPYSASKAASDHLARAWHHTYGLPVIVSNCSNNYGPFQFPEKLIPHMILNALAGSPLPIYGDGQQVRDWLYVDDHARALMTVVSQGRPGETYNIGGCNEQRNLEVVKLICNLLEELAPASKPPGIKQFADLIEFVTDRPGHDTRYAIDAGKIISELGWRPQESFESGLRKTVQWYLDNEAWWQRVLSGDYRLGRLGVAS